MTLKNLKVDSGHAAGAESGYMLIQLFRDLGIWVANVSSS